MLTIDGAASLQELKLEFEEFRRSSLKQIDQLTREVQELRKEVNGDGKSKKASRNQKSPKAVAVGEAITYSDAFAEIGGSEELIKYAKKSEELTNFVNNAKLQKELKRFFPIDPTKRVGFSTILVNQSYVTDLDQLYSKAENIFEDFSITLHNLASKNNDCRAIVGPLKSKFRARMKAAFKYRNANGGISWYRLTDLVRGTLQFTKIADLYDGLENVIEFFGRGENVKELNDRYQKPLSGGYRDIQIVVNFKGHMCEIQLNTEQMMRAKNTTGHRNYEVLRELKAAVEVGDLSRVLDAFEFAKQAVGSHGDSLEELLKGRDASTLLHSAAINGYAQILHAFLLNGADSDVQNSEGDTPLHLATFHGHEPCVWVLLHEGNADLDITNKSGHTALVKGYLMLWKRPKESQIRALSTLAQVAGLDRIQAAVKKADYAIKDLLHQSSILVDHAKDGNRSKMLNELYDYADPSSKRDGQSALAMTIKHDHLDAAKLLFAFKVNPSLDDLCVAIKLNKFDFFDLLSENCDLSSYDNTSLIAAAHQTGPGRIRKWLRHLHKNGINLKNVLDTESCGIFTFQNAWLGRSEYIGFTDAHHRLRAIYSLHDAMPIELFPVAGKPDTYKLLNRWPNENRWISYSNQESKWLFCTYEESDAMPVKFVPFNKAKNEYKMRNMWDKGNNNWIGFTDDGTWLRIIYNESDAMPVRLTQSPKSLSLLERWLDK